MADLPVSVRFEGVCPILGVEDLAKSLDHYVNVLGFKVDWNYENVIASVSRDRCCIFLSEDGQGKRGSWAWVGVSDCGALHEELVARGAKVRMPPTNFTWAFEMHIEDLDGNVLRMGSEPKEDEPFGVFLGPQDVRWREIAEHRWERVLRSDDPLAIDVKSAIQTGDVDRLQQLLAANPSLAHARIVDGKGVGRTLLHVAADWPGHFPNGAKTVAALIAAGADPSAACPSPDGKTAETPLHWAASSDDVEVLDALLDGGANIEAPGAVFTGGTAMSDAVVFAQWNAARRLLERGARTTLSQAAALGLVDRLDTSSASQDEITNALWHACHGGQRRAAEILVERGADVNWIGWDHKTPLDVAKESGNEELIGWLRERGAQ